MNGRLAALHNLFIISYRYNGKRKLQNYEIVDAELKFEDETIQFETKCEKCHQKEIHQKEIKITQPPKILILSLKR